MFLAYFGANASPASLPDRRLVPAGGGGEERVRSCSGGNGSQGSVAAMGRPQWGKRAGVSAKPGPKRHTSKAQGLPNLLTAVSLR